MKRQILINVNDKEFTYSVDKPIVAGDANAYEVVLVVPYDVMGSVFSVTAIKPDAVRVFDAQVITDTTAAYVLKNNMYDVAGDTTFRLTMTKDATVLTAAELIVPVVVANGEPDLTGNNDVPALASLIALTSTAVAGANQAAEDADQAKTDLLAAAENGDFDGADGTDGTTPHIGENGNWFIGSTDTGIKAEAINENIVVKYTSETPIPYDSIDSATAEGRYKIDMGDDKILDLIVTTINGDLYQFFLNRARWYDYGMYEWNYWVSSVIPITGPNSPSAGFFVITSSTTPDQIPIIYNYAGGFVYKFSFSEGKIKVSDNSSGSWSTPEEFTTKTYVDDAIVDGTDGVISLIGALLALHTTAKSNIVSAINELADRITALEGA